MAWERFAGRVGLCAFNASRLNLAFLRSPIAPLLTVHTIVTLKQSSFFVGHCSTVSSVAKSVQFTQIFPIALIPIEMTDVLSMKM